jgi:hypothetical protein
VGGCGSECPIELVCWWSNPYVADLVSAYYMGKDAVTAATT